MRSKSIEAYKKGLSLTRMQRELLVGMLLGDGHLETQDRGRTYRLKVEHSVQQKDYVDWLYGHFAEWVRQPPKTRKRVSLGKLSMSYGFTTYSSGSFRFYAQQFYRGRKKVIPKLIRKLLSPTALAVWFMDDGSAKSNRHRGYVIYALGYAKEELRLVQEILQRKFAIASVLHRHRNAWRLYIGGDSARTFRYLIDAHIVPSMRYKLGEQRA